jgi:hypothetical protein
VRELVRLSEPWRVSREGERITVCDANGILLVELPRDGIPQIHDGLTDVEAEELARLIARLPVLLRRPQY